MTLFLSVKMGITSLQRLRGKVVKGKEEERNISKQVRHWALLEVSKSCHGLIDSTSQVSLPTPLPHFCYLSS